MLHNTKNKFKYRAKDAWQGNDIKRKLEEGVCEFTFFELKEDGSMTKRVGTRNREVLGELEAFEPPLGVREVPPTQIVFWDLSIDEWRSFRKSEFGSIIDYVDAEEYIEDYLTDDILAGIKLS